MSINPKVTVYLVNYNYGQYIEQAIESVLQQTLQDFELLVIDDGSKDNSYDVISKYAHHEKVITVFQENKGLNRTNNVALDLAKGEYIMRLDADDYLDEHALELMANYLDRRPSVGLVFPDYYHVDKDGHVLDMMRRHNFDEVTQKDQPAHGACTMIRRDNLLTLDGYDESFRCQDGWDLWVRFTQRFGVANINLPLFYYRQHDASLTKDENRILSTRSKIFEKNTPGNGDPLNGIAIIPVRGPSLDARSPVLLPLGEKLVIDWSIDAALKARHISKVIVTSPDEQVENHIADRYGADVIFIKRNWRLATVNKPLDETLTVVMNDLPSEYRFFDIVALLFCESPFRNSIHIDSAIDAMEIFNCNRVLSVRRIVEQCYIHSGEGMESLVSEGRLLRHEKDMLYKRAGDLFVVRRGHYFRDVAEDKHLGHIEVDEKSALKIQSDWTYNLAKLYAENLLSQSSS